MGIGLSRSDLENKLNVADAVAFCEADPTKHNKHNLGKAIAMELLGASSEDEVRTMFKPPSPGETEFFGQHKDYSARHIFYLQINQDLSLQRFAKVASDVAERLILTQSQTYHHPPDSHGGYKSDEGGYMQLRTLTSHQLWSSLPCPKTIPPSVDVDEHQDEADELPDKNCPQTAMTTPTQRQGVYANAVVTDGRRVWLSVGRTGRQTFAVRHDEYYNGKWFCCDDKTGKSITAEISFKYMLDRLESLGWAREWHELSLDPESEKHHWEQLQPILQRGRSGPLFSKVLKLNGRAPETGFDNWYVQGGYGNKAQHGEPSIRAAAIELLKPEIEKLIDEIEGDL